MRRYWMSLAIMGVIFLSGHLPLSAHEGHDHGKAKSGNDRGRQAAASPSPTHPSVAIKLFQYQPARLQVAAGTTVTWVNEDDIFHSVTADKIDPGFDAPLDGKGKSFSFVFSQPGAYAYHCERHEHMRGEVEVK
jgi:plastocyanin